MKVMFVFFTFLNAVLILWQFTTTEHVSADTATTLNIPKNAKRLVLVTEEKVKQTAKKQKKRREAKKLPVQVASKSRSTQGTRDKFLCYSLGPFDQKRQMVPLSKTLRNIGTRTNPRKLRRRVSTGYWVYLPQFETWKAARMKVIQLEAKGMQDIFIMGRGKMKNAVSLGLYNSRKAAKTRIDRISTLGVKAKMEAKYTVQEEYWLDLNVDSQNQHEIDSINAIAKSLTLLELRPRKCG